MHVCVGLMQVAVPGRLGGLRTSSGGAPTASGSGGGAIAGEREPGLCVLCCKAYVAEALMGMEVF